MASLFSTLTADATQWTHHRCNCTAMDNHVGGAAVTNQGDTAGVRNGCTGVAMGKGVAPLMRCGGCVAMGDSCTGMAMAKGMAPLIRRAGHGRSITARLVSEMSNFGKKEGPQENGTQITGFRLGTETTRI